MISDGEDDVSVQAVPDAGVHCGAVEEGVVEEGVVEVTWKRAPEDGRAVNCAGRQNPRPPMRPPGSVDHRCGIG